jgi:hypothetical protein
MPPSARVNGRSPLACPALGDVPLHRRQPHGPPPREEALLRFVRLELPGTFPDTRDQRLERLLACRDPALDIECVHGEPPHGGNIGTLHPCSRVSLMDEDPLHPETVALCHFGAGLISCTL